MIRIAGRFACYGEVWFDEPVPSVPDVDVLSFRLRSAPLAGRACSTFLSLINDLSCDEAAILARFSNTNRYQVHRADTKDGLSAEFMTGCEHLAAFSTFYDDFAGQKGLPCAYRRGLSALSDARHLVLTRASRDDFTIVWHAYVANGRTAALLHSASHFRTTRNIDTAIVGRANRWLHWQDLLYFKRRGLQQFDWGGLFEDESLPGQAGVNRFKRQFGGVPVRTYNCTVPLTAKGRLYLALRHVVDRWSTRAGRFPVRGGAAT
jgi:hypothetical protein